MTLKNTKCNDSNDIVVKKRGRKSKKVLQEALINTSSVCDDNLIIEKGQNNCHDNNSIIDIVCANDDNSIINNDIIDIVNENMSDSNNDNDIDILQDNLTQQSVIPIVNFLEEEKTPTKKRGRKPKGGKIIQQIVYHNNNKEPKPNVILHLKCSLKELTTNNLFDSKIESFNFSSNNKISFENIEKNENNTFNLNPNSETNTYSKPTYFKYDEQDDDDDAIDYDDDSIKNANVRDVWKKLKVLQNNLHLNNIVDKKSACFWCTYDFDNHPIYIPKHYIKNSYHVYGCFCSPECATAYLMEENIDNSSKFERYHLINHIYSKIYDYKKNIKPAPNPYYMLDKFYGNLSIQEYRSLLRNERLFLVIDKPLTRTLPELHEENDDFIINNKIIPSNTYQIKKKLQKKLQTKSNILTEKFGLLQ